MGREHLKYFLEYFEKDCDTNEVVLNKQKEFYEEVYSDDKPRGRKRKLKLKTHHDQDYCSIGHKCLATLKYKDKKFKQ